jgi:hypothetical protein
MEQALNSPRRSATTAEGQAAPQWRKGWLTKVLIPAALLVLVVASIAGIRSIQRHRASTYGIARPYSALLVENKTGSFAVTRVTLEGTGGDPAEYTVLGEIGNGAEASAEIAPGSYLAKVSYVEIIQLQLPWPKGTLTAPFSVAPGKAAILRLQGGRSSSGSLLFFPPELAVK